MWSLGVTLFAMLGGYFPFGAQEYPRESTLERVPYSTVERVPCSTPSQERKQELNSKRARIPPPPHVHPHPYPHPHPRPHPHHHHTHPHKPTHTQIHTHPHTYTNTHSTHTRVGARGVSLRARMHAQTRHTRARTRGQETSRAHASVTFACVESPLCLLRCTAAHELSVSPSVLCFEGLGHEPVATNWLGSP